MFEWQMGASVGEAVCEEGCFEVLAGTMRREISWWTENWFVDLISITEIREQNLGLGLFCTLLGSHSASLTFAAVVSCSLS
jgi:hypothetical protein